MGVCLLRVGGVAPAATGYGFARRRILSVTCARSQQIAGRWGYGCVRLASWRGRLRAAAGRAGAGCALDSGAQVPLAAAMVTNGLMYMPLKLKEVCFGQKEGDVYGVLPLQVDWFGKKGGGLWRKPR